MLFARLPEIEEYGIRAATSAAYERERGVHPCRIGNFGPPAAA